MTGWFRLIATGVLTLGITLGVGASLGMAQTRAHVYLFRGLADVYSLGMNTLADELNARGVDATAHSHTDWKPIADKAAADYKAGKEGPIILIGHSLGADAVMEMADYLGDKGVPVALVVPFDGTQSFPVPGNVGRLINFTQRDYAYMHAGLGFRGLLSNVDLSADRSIDHLNIDKSPRLHARVISEVLALVGGRRVAAPNFAKPASSAEAAAPAPRAKRRDGTMKSTETGKAMPDGGTPAVAPLEAPAGSATQPTSPPQKPAVDTHPANPAEFPD